MTFNEDFFHCKTQLTQRKRFKPNALKPFAERGKMRKTSLFEFDVPIYRKRPIGLAANNKQAR